MTAYRFRVKLDPDPTALWRDVVVGADRTVEELQAAINRSVGLDRGHLWFVGTDEDFWSSDVKYHSSRELEGRPEDAPQHPGETTRDAGETTVGEMARQLGLERYDRICYLYDYGDEWRFYAILKEVLDDEPDDEPPAVVAREGDPVEQYGPPAGSVLPEPLDSLRSEAAVPTADLRALEDRDDVVHVLVLHGVETGDGRVADRFAVQLDEAGYVLEHFQGRWEVVARVDGEGRSEEEVLAALVVAVRDWHDEVAEFARTAAGGEFDRETVEEMDAALEAELERLGHGNL